MRIPRLHTAFALLPLLVLSCSDGSPTGPDAVVSTPPTVQIEPLDIGVIVGENLLLGAQLVYADGAVVPNAGPAIWSSANTGIAAITAAGRVTGIGAGETTVRAEIGGTFAEAAVAVSPAPIDSLTLTPAGDSVAVGDAVTFEAQAHGPGGSEAGDVVFEWSVADTLIASIDTSGTVTGEAAGTTELVVRAGTLERQAMLLVYEPGASDIALSAQTLALESGQAAAITAVVTTEVGEVLPAPVSWTSGDTTVATVAEDGIVTGQAAGTTWVEATVEDVTARADVSVTFGVATSVSVEPVGAGLLVGAELQLTGTEENAHGALRANDASLAWATDQAAIAVVSASGLVTAESPGQAKISVLSADGPGATATIDVTGVPASVDIVGAPTALEAGVQAALSATVRDAVGTVLDSDVTWTSSAATVLDVGAEGAIDALAAGTADIVATVQGVADTVSIDVVWGAPASIDGLPASITLGIGESRQFDATVRNAQGVTIPDTDVVYSSDAPSVASVSAAGLVTAQAEGQALVMAQAGTAATGVPVTVSNPPLALFGAVPNDLIAGSEVTLTGTGFGADVGALAVTVGGVAATVLEASGTSLRIQVAPAFQYECAATGFVPIHVVRGAEEGQINRPLQVAERLALEPGEDVRYLSAPAIPCIELADASGDYAVAVVHGSTNANAAAGYRLVGELGTTFEAGPAYEPAPLMSVRSAPAMAPEPPPPGAEDHTRLLEQNRELARHFTPRSSAAAAGVIVNALSVQVGDVVPLRFPQWTSLCQYTPVNARVLHVGTRSVVLENTANESAGMFDAEYAAIGEMFDDRTYALVRDNFADPLAMDAQLDGDGKVWMLYTDGFSGSLAGFVTTADMLNRSSCPSSDGMEIYYGRAINSDQYNPTRWFGERHGLTAHEVKHLASYVARLPNNWPLETSWLEEGTAQIAAEALGQSLYGYGPDTNSAYADGFICEREGPAYCEYTHRPTMWLWSWLRVYLGGTEARSPIGNPNGDNSFYGSSWFFLRWMADQHAVGGQAAYFSSLTQSSRTGLDNLLAASDGSSARALFAGFAAAIAADDLDGFIAAPGSDAELTSWNWRDILTSMGGTEWPASTATHFGNFAVDGPDIHGASASYIYLSEDPIALVPTAGRPQLIRLQGSGGGIPASTLGLVIVRLP